MRSDAYEQSLAYTRGVSVDELRNNDGSSFPLVEAGSFPVAVGCFSCFRTGLTYGTTVNISGGKSGLKLLNKSFTMS